MGANFGDDSYGSGGLGGASLEDQLSDGDLPFHFDESLLQLPPFPIPPIPLPELVAPPGMSPSEIVLQDDIQRVEVSGKKPEATVETRVVFIPPESYTPPELRGSSAPFAGTFQITAKRPSKVKDLLLSPATDPSIERLHLSRVMREIVYQLKHRHPGLRFTSGTRSVADQARAMAQNVVHKRTWIKGMNYRDKGIRDALQKWVDEHPEAKTVSEISKGLLSVFDSYPSSRVSQFSRHMSGNAIDIKPVPGAEGKAIKDDLRALPGLFFDKENGKEIWHYQYQAPVPKDKGSQPSTAAPKKASAAPEPKKSFAIPEPKKAFAIPEPKNKSLTSSLPRPGLAEGQERRVKGQRVRALQAARAAPAGSVGAVVLEILRPVTALFGNLGAGPIGDFYEQQRALLYQPATPQNIKQFARLQETILKAQQVPAIENAFATLLVG